MEAPPEDVLADILGRLPHRDLVMSRRVCSSWRTLVDTRGLLLRHALPQSVRGLILNYQGLDRPNFFARPTSTGPRIDGNLAFLTDDWPYTVQGHRNGLILVYSENGIECLYETLYVVNPATRRWACLPPAEQRWMFDPYLVFEPAVSPDYEVCLVPSERCIRAWDDDFDDKPAAAEEWPPSSWVLQVLSSRTGRWEKRAFVREGEAAGTVADLKREEPECTWWYQWRHSAYWEEKLYVHCRGCYITRFSLRDNKYQVIKAPTSIDDHCEPQCCLGNSQNRVYYAAFCEIYDLKVWILEESFGQAKWVLKHSINLQLTALNTLSDSFYENGKRWRYAYEGAWNLEDGNDAESCHNEPQEVDSIDEEEDVELPDDASSAEHDTDKWKAVGLSDDKGNKNQVYLDDQSFEQANNGLLYDNYSDEEYTNSEIVEENIDWNSDDDDVLTIRDKDETGGPLGSYLILGFHPYKEVVFLTEHTRGVVYHLNTSKVQYLGTLRARITNTIVKSFVYTPCMIGELPESSSNVRINE